MVKNKPANLNIGGFMNQVRDNQPAERNAAPMQEPDRTIPEQKDETESGRPKEVAENETARVQPDAMTADEPAVQERRGKGRPARATRRNERQIFKLDEESATELMLIKALHRIDIQDVVFAATVDFLNKHFDRSNGLDSEGINLVTRTKEQYENCE